MCYKEGKVGIGTKNPQSELDVSGSVNITGELDVADDLTIGDTVLFVDANELKVGINTDALSYALDVSGDAKIRETLTITNGIGSGAGFCPIGTIIMWATNSFSSGYGEWALCDGNSTSYSKSEYTGLAGLNLETSDGCWVLPDYTSKYLRGASSADTSLNTDGSNICSFDISNLHNPLRIISYRLSFV